MYNFSLYQPNKINQSADYRYSMVSFNFASFSKPLPEPILCDNHNSFKAKLNVGKYKLGITIHWRDSTYPVVFNFYGPS